MSKKAEGSVAALAVFDTKHTFERGQVVEWKPGMKNKRSGGPFVVVEVLAAPIFDTEYGAGSPYSKEPLDIVLGSVDEDGDFLTYHYDSRRFQPVSE